MGRPVKLRMRRSSSAKARRNASARSAASPEARHGSLQVQNRYLVTETDDGMVLNMGPQHPATHGTLRLVAHLDGEQVTSADVMCGYMHRGYEKLTEVRTFPQVNTLINRMNRTQASIYHLGTDAPAMPDFPGYTDVTESTVFVALFGPKAFLVAEKLTNLDFQDPGKPAPFLLQGPFCHVPCQIVTLEKMADGSGGFLLTCSRGYGDSMLHALLEAGAEFGLRPAGENRFGSWIQGLQG